MNIIHTRNLSKSYRRFEKEVGLMGSIRSLINRRFVTKDAVRGFDLDIEEGEFVGLIGPNGAGKTTLVKMLTGIIAPTSGELSVMGYHPNKQENAFKRQYAVVMGQKSQLFFELTAADTFLLFKELYDIPADDYKRNLDYFVTLFGVSEHLNVQVRTLSLGERMKMELIVALLHNPRVLFLDEPTIGLDAVAQKQVRKFLREVNRDKGTTIVLTSHYMEDIKSLCQRCIVINGGEKLYDGQLSALFDKYQTHRKITVTWEQEDDAGQGEAKVLRQEEAPWLTGEGFRHGGGIVILEQSPYRMSFLAKKAEAAEIIKSIMTHYTLTDVAVEDEDIGNIVERIYADRGGCDEKVR